VFMEEALYGEGGYYRRTELPIGEAGDFVTGSSFSPLGRTTARLVRKLDAALGRPAGYFEAGFGAGTTAAWERSGWTLVPTAAADLQEVDRFFQDLIAGRLDEKAATERASPSSATPRARGTPSAGLWPPRSRRPGGVTA